MGCRDFFLGVSDQIKSPNTNLTKAIRFSIIMSNARLILSLVRYPWEREFMSFMVIS